MESSVGLIFWFLCCPRHTTFFSITCFPENWPLSKILRELPIPISIADEQSCEEQGDIFIYIHVRVMRKHCERMLDSLWPAFSTVYYVSMYVTPFLFRQGINHSLLSIPLSFWNSSSFTLLTQHHFYFVSFLLQFQKKSSILFQSPK